MPVYNYRTGQDYELYSLNIILLRREKVIIWDAEQVLLLKLVLLFDINHFMRLILLIV